MSLLFVAKLAGLATAGLLAHRLLPRRYTRRERELLRLAAQLSGPPEGAVDPLVVVEGKRVRDVQALDDEGNLRGTFWRQLVSAARIRYSGAKWTSANETSLHRYVARYCSERGVREYDVEVRLPVITIAVFKQTEMQKLAQSIRAKGLKNGDFRTLFT
jgi:hypothetical protein